MSGEIKRLRYFAEISRGRLTEISDGGISESVGRYRRGNDVRRRNRSPPIFIVGVRTPPGKTAAEVAAEVVAVIVEL